MQFLQFLYPLLQVFLFIVRVSPASTADVANKELLPEWLTSLNDYEILSVRQDGEEDVVHLQRRTTEGENCENDCLTYTGWHWTEEEESHFRSQEEENGENPEDEVKELGFDNEDAENHNRRYELETRTQKKSVRVCEDVVVNGKMVEFKHKIPPHLDPKGVEKKYQQVFDSGDPSDPLSLEWYKLQRHNEMWSKDIPDSDRGKRHYATEHILEANVLKDFLEHDKDLGQNDSDPSQESICVYLVKYWKNKMVKKGVTVDLRVMKDPAKLKDLKKEDKPDYEVKTFPIKKAIEPLRYISRQWPGEYKKRSDVPTPWEYEFVVLAQDINRKKEDLWKGDKLVTEPEVDRDGVMRKNQANSETLEWLMEDKYYEGSMKDWKDRKGKCAAVYRFANLMQLAIYHNTPAIQEIMRQQVLRVGEAFEFIETEILDGETWEGQDKEKRPLKSRGLKQKWFDWIKERHSTELKRLKAVLIDKVRLFKNESPVNTGISKRWELPLFKRAGVKVPKCGAEKNSGNMNKRIKLLLEAWDELDELKDFKTELKLDDDDMSIDGDID